VNRIGKLVYLKEFVSKEAEEVMAKQRPAAPPTNSWTVPIVVAVVGVVGTIAAAIITNWDKLSTSPTVPRSSESSPSTPPVAAVHSAVNDRSVLADIDTASAPGYAVPAAPYLRKIGIAVENIIPSDSELVVVNVRALYIGLAVTPTVSQNILTQLKTGEKTASFTLRFAEPANTVRFVRAALFAATKSGVTHPAWSAHALDASGQELSSQSEALTRSFNDVPAQTYTLIAPALTDIAAIRFDSDLRLDGKPFAGFGAVLIENISTTRRAR
jgi:hypothetical protein